MQKFYIRTQNGKIYRADSKNATTLHKRVIKLLKKDGEYAEILPRQYDRLLITRITKKEGAEHHTHEGYRFDLYDAHEGIKNNISLFKKSDLTRHRKFK